MGEQDLTAALHRIRNLAAALVAPFFIASASLAQPPDLALVNGRIVTLDGRSRIVEAIAIRRERIAAAGTTREIVAGAGSATRIVDLDGRTVIPGLIDSHIHAIRAGLRFDTEVSWIGAASIAEAMERIRIAAARSDQEGWLVVGGGWTPTQFAERRRPTLDEVVAAAPGRRVYVQLFYRAVLMSQEARHALGIEEERALPAGARIELGSDGRPNGWIAADTATVNGLFGRLPSPSLEQAMAGTRRFFSELNAHGITGVIDPGGHNLAPEEYEALIRLAGADRLTLRVAYSISSPRPGSELADLKSLVQLLPMGAGSSMLRFNGIGERVTWGLYNNDAASEAQKEAFYEVGRWAAGRGLALTAHWNNDRSVHHLLDVLERIDRELPIRGLRWSIAHLHDASEASLARMRSMGVGWLMQNGLYFAAPSFIVSRGAAMNRAPPIRTALRIGLEVGGGTDAHRVMSYNPFVSLRWMSDGRTVDGITTRTAGELVSREEALRIYTSGSAWFAFDEHRRGSLEPGRLADLAVLDRDFLTVPAEELGATRSLLTLVGGRPVHAVGPYAQLLR